MKDFEKRIQDANASEFPSKLEAYCSKCEISKEFYFIGIQENPKGDDFALYNCPTCRHTFSYNTLINQF